MAESFLLTGPVEVQFTGYRQDGSTVGITFTTDGVMDGSGPLTDFETFHFDTDSSNLLRVEIPTSDWALDNLVFSVIPEPGTWGLVVVGSLLLGFRRLTRVRSRLGQ